MAFSPKYRSTLMRLMGRAVAGYMRFVYRTSRVIIDARRRRSAHLRDSPLHPVHVARPVSDDAAPAHGACSRRRDRRAPRRRRRARRDPDAVQISLVHGSGAGARQKDRGGVYALRAATKAAEGRHDVLHDCRRAGRTRPPRGRRHRHARASFSGRPIMPFAVASSRFIALKTWSRMTINLPFSKLAYVIGEPDLGCRPTPMRKRSSATASRSRRRSMP